MQRQLKIQIQTLAICGLLLLSAVDVSECRKTQVNSKKSKGGGTQTVRPKTVSNTQHANPASFSYGGVSPNAPQPPKPSAPVQQPSYAARPSYPVSQGNTQQNSGVNPQSIGWNQNLNNQQRPQSAAYPTNNQAPYPTNNQQVRPQSAPYPTNNQAPYPTNNQQPHGAAYPTNQQHGAPPPYSNQYPQQPAQHAAGNYPQQPAQAGYNPQPNYPQQAGYNPQPNYPQQQPAYGGGSYAPQPQVVHHVVQPVQPYQQQGGGGSFLKTAAIGGAAGLGTALLYNQFTKNDDPKTTVIVVNNTQPAAAPAAAAPAAAETPVQPQPVNNANPPPPYQQQPYDPNLQYNQQQYPNNQQQFPPQQQPYDPNFPQQQYNPALVPQQQPFDPNQQQPQQFAPPLNNGNPNPAEPGVANTEAPKLDSEATTTISATEVLSTTMSELKSTASEKGITPPDALNSRATETVELKETNHQTSPQTQSSDGKLHNNSSQLQYSIVMMALAVIYHLVPKFL